MSDAELHDAWLDLARSVRLAKLERSARVDAAMVSYFDPATGKAQKRKPKAKPARKREGGITAMHPRRVTVTVGGKTYDSMKSAALALGCSHTRLTVARREGRTELDGVPLSFGEAGA